jgi:predicted P-loop ATPase/GTPase
MRHIPLRVIPAPPGSRFSDFSYRDALRQVLLAAPANGSLSSDQILARVEVARILAAVSPQADALVLEEDQYRTLLSAEKTFPWAVANEEIADFITAIRNAPKIDPNGA